MISNKYLINDQISTGSYGMVYNGVNIRTKEEVALKIIKKEDEIVFRNECSIYKFLAKDKNFAQMKWVSFTEDYFVIVLTKLGSSIKIWQSQQITNELLKNIVLDLFLKIDILHSYNIIHRDIKPNNIVVSPSDTQRVFLLDFSYSTFTIDEFFQLKSNKGISDIIGSIFYCSLNVHDRQTPSKRDDLESACYVVGQLINKVNWLHLKYEKNIIEEKEQFSNNIDIPWFKLLYDTIRKLEFYESLSFESIQNIILKTI